MKKVSFNIFISISMLLILLCSQSRATTSNNLLAKTTFKLYKTSELLNVKKFKINEKVGITITNKLGKKLLDFSSMGAKEKLFTVGNEAKSIAIKDITGDGVPEVITTAYYGPASALYVFKYDQKADKFAPIKFIDSKDAEMNRDYMISDMPQDNGFDMTILENNQIRSLGKIYPSALGERPKVGYYYFKLENDGYKLIRTEVLK